MIWTVTATAQMAGLNLLTWLTAYLDECGRNGGKPLAGPDLGPRPALERQPRRPPHLGTATAIARINPRRTRPHRRGCEPATPAMSMPLHRTSEYLRGFRYRPRGGSEVGR